MSESGISLEVDRLTTLGNKQLDSGAISEAIASLEKALVLCPSYAHVWHWLGYAYSAANRNREAILCFHRLISIEPESSNTMTSLAVVLLRVGHSDAASGWVKRALDLNPRDTLARELLLTMAGGRPRGKK